MQGIAARWVLTDKPQPLAWTVLLGGMPAPRTPLRGVICIDFDRQGTGEHRFVADQGVGVLFDDPFGERVIGLQFEPSLSLGNASDGIGPLLWICRNFRAPIKRR